MKIKLIFSIILFLLAPLWAVENSSNTVDLSLYGKPSKKELFAKARDVLKDFLQEKNQDKAKEAFQYLRANVTEGAPLTKFEEYLILMELGEYESGIRILSDLRRQVFDSTYVPTEDRRIISEDALSLYLYRPVNPFTKQVADSLFRVVNASDTKQEYKDLYVTLLYSELVIGIKTIKFYGQPYSFLAVRDTTYAENFLKYAKKYSTYNLYEDQNYYIKDVLIPFVETFMKDTRDFAKDPFTRKYYSGGLEVFYSKSKVFFTGDASKYYSHKKSEDSYMIEGVWRKNRFLFGVSYASSFYLSRNYNDYFDYESSIGSIQLTLGFNAFDSRFLRIEPFIGPSFISNATMTEDQIHWALGSNIDLRLYATKPKTINGASFALLLRFKYMVQFASIDDAEYKINNVETGLETGYINHYLSLGIGVGIW